MTRYLISFDDGAMTFPEEELPAVAEAAHAVAQEAKDSGVWVFAGAALAAVLLWLTDDRFVPATNAAPSGEGS